MAPLDPSDPKSQERLQLLPIGQDMQRKRYWVADGPCTFTPQVFPSFYPSYLRVFARCTFNISSNLLHPGHAVRCIACLSTRN